MLQLPAIYASTSGNVEWVVETIGHFWQDAQIDLQPHRSELVDLKMLHQQDLFMFACSTWEHGVVNPYFNRVLDEMKNMDAQGKSAVFVGCGDNRYEPVLWNTAIQTIMETWTEKGGQTIGFPLKINGEPTLVKDTLIKTWAERTAPLLTQTGEAE